MKGCSISAADKGATLHFKSASTWLAIAWVLRDPRMTSAIIGASSAAQVRENLGPLKQLSFTKEELAAIDRIAPGPV